MIISCDEALKFEPVESGSPLGMLKVPEREGILRAIDGQHRLLALHADIERFGDEHFTVPAIIFDRLPEDHVVQMFVTINAKHTRLNASHLVSLSGRQLYRDENLAAAHDVVRALNDREDSPLYGEIKLLGVGTGRVAQAPLAQELKKLFATEAFGAGKKGEAFREESKKFYVNYLKQVAQVFGAAWNGRKYSIKSATALRAFVRVAPDVVRRLDQEHADRTDFRAIGRVDRSLGPPHRRSAVRNRGGLEARRDDGGFAGEGTAAGPAVSRRRSRLADKKKGTVLSDGAHVLPTARLPSNSRLPAVNIQTVCTTLLSKGRTAVFPNDSRERLFIPSTNFAPSITILADRPFSGVPCRSGRQTGVKPGSDPGLTPVAGQVVDGRTGAPLEKVLVLVEDAGKSVPDRRRGTVQRGGPSPRPPSPVRLGCGLLALPARSGHRPGHSAADGPPERGDDDL